MIWEICRYICIVNMYVQVFLYMDICTLVLLKLIYWIVTHSIIFISGAATATAKSLQSCPTLCDPIDGSPPGSPVPGILQTRTLERIAISFSNAWKWKVKGKSLSRVQLLATPWTTAYQAPPSMGISRQEYWSGVPLPQLTLIHSYCGCACKWCHWAIW